jgi:hypothetical protein
LGGEGSGAMWRTKDGREIRVRDMDDDHLRAAIRGIEKRASEEHSRLVEDANERLERTTSEEGRDMIRRALEEISARGSDPEGAHPLYTTLTEERDRRGLCTTHWTER